MIRDIKKKSEITGSELDCLFGFNSDKMIQNEFAVPSVENPKRNLQAISYPEDPTHRVIGIQSLSVDQPPEDAKTLEIDDSHRYVLREISDFPDEKLENPIISILERTENEKSIAAKKNQQLAIQQILKNQKTAKNLIVESQVNLVLTKQNTMDLFIAERCNIGPSELTLFTPLWEAYKDWVKENRINEPLNYQEFLRELRRRGFTPGKKFRGNRFRSGISLKPPGTEAEAEAKAEMEAEAEMEVEVEVEVLPGK